MVEGVGKSRNVQYMKTMPGNHHGSRLLVRLRRGPNVQVNLKWTYRRASSHVGEGG